MTILPFSPRRLAVFTALLLSPPIAAQQPAVLTKGQRDRIDSLVKSYQKDNSVVAVSYAVARGDRTLVATGSGFADLEVSAPATAETIYRIGSITKQFTAALVMRLVEQGKVSLDDEITKYFPGYPTQGHRVTVHHLLNHTSGIKSYTSLDPVQVSTVWRQVQSGDQMMAMFKDRPFDFAPGEKYAYNNSGYFLLGLLIEKVTGESYPAHLTKTLLEPLGLTSTSYCDESAIVPHRAHGYRRVNGQVSNALRIDMSIPAAAGAMCANVTDLVRWTRLLHTGGVVSPASYARMTTGVTLANGQRSNYGYGLGMGQLDGRNTIAHSGGINGFSVQQIYLPSEELSVLVFTNAEGGPLGVLAQNIARVSLGLPLPTGGAR